MNDVLAIVIVFGLTQTFVPGGDVGLEEVPFGSNLEGNSIQEVMSNYKAKSGKFCMGVSTSNLAYLDYHSNRSEK